MQLLSYLIGLVLISLIASVSVVAILVYADPTVSNSLIFILFYIFLFISATSVLTLIGWFIRRVSRIKKYSLSVKQAVRQLEVSFRQGLLLTSILVSSLVLQAHRALAWWHLLLLVGLVGVAEWWMGGK